MKRFALFLLVATVMATQTVSAKDKGETQIIKMGQSFGRDSSCRSGRWYDKKLVIPKGSTNVGLQCLYLNLDTSNAEVLMLVTGMSGNSSLFRIAPSFGWSFANNHVLGIRAAYSNINVNLENINVNLLSDNLKFSASNVKTNIQSIRCGIYERNYFGLDNRGIFSIFTEFMLSYAFSKSGGGSDYAISNEVSLSFNPGFEAFVLNNLSLMFSIGLADVTYSDSKSYSSSKGDGSSQTFDAQASLNLANLNFGLTFYF